MEVWWRYLFGAYGHKRITFEKVEQNMISIKQHVYL